MAKKTSPKRLLNDAPPENCFWCCDGKIFKNLAELESGLKNMPVKTYVYHTSKGKNDFSSWVADVLGDKKLASDLKKCKTKSSALKKVSERIKK